MTNDAMTKAQRMTDGQCTMTKARVVDCPLGHGHCVMVSLIIGHWDSFPLGVFHG